MNTTLQRTAGFGRSVPSGVISGVVDTITLWFERAANRRRLAQLDPRLLEDIGLDGQALHQEISKPFWRA